MLFHPNDYKNSVEALDLYAVIEDMTQVKEVAPILYEEYLKILNSLDFDSLLDLGCGAGDFLLGLKKVYPNKKLEGIDLSPKMVQRALSKGVEAKAEDICNLNSTYDVITAVFDMLNYIPPFELDRFLQCVKDRLNSGGYFICDINTLYAFEEIASGSLIIEEDDKFLAIDSYFEDGISISTFTLFKRVEDNLYSKNSQKIKQFYHLVDDIIRSSKMKKVKLVDVKLYSDEVDKTILVLQKED